MKPTAILALRKRLELEPGPFAKIVGVDIRTVTRWESGQVSPSGAPLGILSALREKLDTDPQSAPLVVRLVSDAAAMGGLPYLLKKLLDGATANATPRTPS